MKKEFGAESGEFSVTVEDESIGYTYRTPEDVKKVHEPEKV